MQFRINGLKKNKRLILKEGFWKRNRSYNSRGSIKKQEVKEEKTNDTRNYK